MPWHAASAGTARSSDGCPSSFTPCDMRVHELLLVTMPCHDSRISTHQLYHRSTTLHTAAAMPAPNLLLHPYLSHSQVLYGSNLVAWQAQANGSATAVAEHIAAAVTAAVPTPQIYFVVLDAAHVLRASQNQVSCEPACQARPQRACRSSIPHGCRCCCCCSASKQAAAAPKGSGCSQQGH